MLLFSTGNPLVVMFEELMWIQAIQIGAYKPGKGRGDTKSVQENK